MKSTSQKKTVAEHEVEVIWSAAREGDDPPEATLAEWAIQALGSQNAEPCEIALKVVDEQESQALNQQYRQKDQPTNVLSFPLDAGLPGGERLLLGDLAICAAVVRQEALAQGKPLEAHFAHMVVHGVLHLLGYDHIEEAEAAEMEQIEINILRTMGFPDPYESMDAG